jgi:excisionase family DNA binding protein
MAKVDTREDLVAEGVYTLEEAARLLTVNVRTVYEYMDKGIIPWTKVGGRRKIPVVALRRYLARGLQCQTAVN